ncbi:MAG: hypothetical protein J6W64_06890, partial [Bacilli bacterium]|nr:hypothetical protein [Bacilli bacterium]
TPTPTPNNNSDTVEEEPVEPRPTGATEYGDKHDTWFQYTNLDEVIGYWKDKVLTGEFNPEAQNAYEKRTQDNGDTLSEVNQVEADIKEEEDKIAKIYQEITAANEKLIGNTESLS